MTERAAKRPLGAFLRLAAARLQSAAGWVRDRAFDTPVRTGSGADLKVRSAFVRFRGTLARVLLALVLQGASATFSPAAAQSTPPGTVIDNVAQASYVRGQSTITTAVSNTVATVVVPPASRATIELLRPAASTVIPAASASGAPEPSGPTQCVGTTGVQSLPEPVLIGGAVIDPTQPRVFVGTASYHGGEPVFVRVVDPNRNRDAYSWVTCRVRPPRPCRATACCR
jgi:hypothetical protein